MYIAVLQSIYCTCVGPILLGLVIASEDELEHAVPTFPKPTSVWLWTSELWHSHFAVSLCKWQFHLAVSLSSSFVTWQFHLAVLLSTKFVPDLWDLRHFRKDRNSNVEISLPFRFSGSAFVFPFLLSQR